MDDDATTPAPETDPNEVATATPATEEAPETDTDEADLDEEDFEDDEIELDEADEDAETVPESAPVWEGGNPDPSAESHDPVPANEALDDAAPASEDAPAENPPA